MLYKPKYCNECGSEVKRDDWKIWTSRQFCETCESDFNGRRFFPVIWLVFGLTGLIYGFGSYLKSPVKPVNLVTTSNTEIVSNKNRSLQNQSNPQISKDANVQSAGQKTVFDNGNQQGAAADLKQKSSFDKQISIEKAQIPVTEAIYICGAQTKKGTACLRRVKGGGRCWQHTGQAAILPPEKLIVSQ